MLDNDLAQKRKRKDNRKKECIFVSDNVLKVLKNMNVVSLNFFRLKRNISIRNFAQYMY